MKTKIKKTIAILPMLFLLTGCFTHYQYKDNFWDLTLCSITNSYLNFVQGLNEVYVKTVNIVSENIMNMGQMVSKYVDLYGTSLASIVTVTSILAAAAILVRFAMSVFKNNMAEQNREMAPDFVTVVKKIIVSIIVTFCIPYICITSFVASGYLGGSVANSLIETELENQDLDIYETMNQYGVKYSTYCRTGQTKADFPKDGNIGEIMYLDKSNSEELTGKSYEYWCGNGKQPNVFLATFQEGQTHDNAAPMKASTDTIVLLKQLAVIVIVAVVSFFMTFSIAKLAIEMLFNIATGWWYTSSYLTDSTQERESSLSKFFKNVLKTCLTVFFLTFELALFVILVMIDTKNFNIVLAIAFLLVMFSTPSAIGDMIQQTGTGSQALSGVAGIGRKFGLIK